MTGDIPPMHHPKPPRLVPAPLKTALLSLLLIGTLAIAGCGRFISHGRPYLVTNRRTLRRPSAITAWVLRQSGEGRIEHGLQVLLMIIVQKRGLAQQTAAARGFVKICRKLRRGWPGFRGRVRPWLPYDPRYGTSPGQRGGPRQAWAFAISVLADDFPVRRTPAAHLARVALRRVYEEIKPNKKDTRTWQAWRRNRRYLSAP